MIVDSLGVTKPRILTPKRCDNSPPPSIIFIWKSPGPIIWHLEACWSHGKCTSGLSRFEPWLGTLCCVLEQDTVLLQWLFSTQFINGYLNAECWGITLTPIHGDRNSTSCLTLQKLGITKHQPDGPLVLYADLINLTNDA